MLQLKDDNGNELPKDVQDRVNNFIDKLPTIPWFKPSKDLKKSDVEKQINFTLECFGVKAGIEYKKITKKEDWASAWDSAWDSAWASAWDSALDSALDSARDSARASALDSALASARASARDSAWDSARDSARDSAWYSALASALDSARDSARASAEIIVDDNEDFKNKYPNGAFKQLFKLWDMGLYPVGILKGTGKFTVYVPEINLDTWLNEEETLANDGMPKQEVEGTLLEEKLLHSLGLHKKLPIQGERVEIRAVHQGTTSTWDEAIFVCFFLNKPLVKFDDDTFDVFDEWRYPPKKTELTLAEVEERLGLEAGSLIIK